MKTHMESGKAAPRVSFLLPWHVLALTVALELSGVANAAIRGPVEAATGQNLTITSGDTVVAGARHAISATGGGTVTGANIEAISTDATIDGAAVFASGAGSSVTLNAPGSAISGRYVGAWMESGGVVNLGAGTNIGITGIESPGSAGIVIKGGVTPAMGSGITVTINGSGAPRATTGAWIGVSADSAGTSAGFNGLTVQGTDVNLGAVAANGATLSFSNSSFSVNGVINGPNLFVWPIALVELDLWGFGLLAAGGGVINADNTAIRTGDGASYEGVAVQQNSVFHGRSMFLDIGGSGPALSVSSRGVLVTGGSSAALTDSIIIMRGDNSSGVRVSEVDSVFTASNTHIVAHGAGSSALVADSAGRAVLEGGTLTTDGAGSFGMWVAGAGADLIGSTVSAQGSGSVGVRLSSVGPVLNMSGGSVYSRGTALRVFPSGADVTVNLADGAVITGGNGLALDVAGGATVLNARNGVILNGDMQTATLDNTAVRLSGNTVWTGAARNIGDVGISGGSLWNMTADSDLRNLTLAGSAVAFAAPGASGYKTLTVRGDYSAAGGLIGLNTSLGGNSSPTDMMIVQGDTSGASALRIANTDGVGALTSGEGIKLVDVAGTSAGIFSLSGRAAAGLYEYYLHQGAADGDWYLRSHVDTPNGPVPNIRPEAPLATAAVPLAREYGHLMLDSLHKRVGETRAVAGGEQENTANSPFSGSWARVIGGRGFHNASGDIMDNGVDYDYSVSGIQAGIDLYARKGEDGSADKIGLYAGYGRISSDVGGIRATSSGLIRSGSSGSIDMDAYSLAAYWTHLSSLSGSGWYSDFVAQGTYYHLESESAGAEQGDAQGAGLLASVEGGYSFALGRGMAVEPQAQLVWQRIFMQDQRDSYGKFSFRDEGSLRGRASLRLVKIWSAGNEEAPRTLSAWVRGNIWSEFMGTSKTDVFDPSGAKRATLNTATSGAWGEAEAGVSGQISENVRVFATASYQRSLDGEEREGWDGQAGIAIEW